MSSEAFQPNWFSKPGDTIAKLMSSKGMSVHMLADAISMNPSSVSGLISGTVRISPRIAVLLSKSLGGESEFWEKRQASYDATISRMAELISDADAANWLAQIPVKDMTAYGWIEPSRRNSERLKSCMAYFGVSGPQEWHSRYASFSNNVAFRKSQAFQSQLGAIATWLRKGEMEADLVLCEPWSRDRLQASLGDLRKLSQAKAITYSAPRARRICAAAGVALVFVRTPAGCRASGAAKFLTPTKAAIVVSFRHRSDDHFWFTLFHEIGHLLLHGAGHTFVDMDDASVDHMENEANEFAARSFVSSNRVPELDNVAHRKRDIIRLAVSLGVSPGIIVGQLQHRGRLGHDKMNFLKTRYSWEEIELAFA